MVSEVYQLKITLRDITPPIWRRILVPGAMRLDHLHRAIQIAMGWSNCHLYEFAVGRLSWGLPEADLFGDSGTQRASKATVEHVLPAEKSSMVYVYDFGDDWRHGVTAEKILPASAALELPVCVAGKRACPPEDVGGPFGYADFLEKIQDPEHEEHDDMREWAGADFDPEKFELAAVNANLRDLFATPRRKATRKQIERRAEANPRPGS
jgi:hypothetical protein